MTVLKGTLISEDGHSVEVSIRMGAAPITTSNGGPKKYKDDLSAVNTGRLVPKEYWESKDRELLGGPNFFPKKVNGQYYIHQKGNGSGRPIEWEKFLYRYKLPFHISGVDMAMVRGSLKADGAKWRPSKDKEKNPIPGGDDSWYSNSFRPDLRDYCHCVAATHLPDGDGDLNKSDGQIVDSEIEDVNIDNDDIPF